VSQRIHINAVAYQEGGAWIAQGIEYDIVAFADDPFRLADAFSRAVFENICITEHLGRNALEGVKPAPQRFREMYDDASYEVRPTKQRADAEVAVRVAA
jgi:hypothetical protein